jgi:ferric iron reductase protein FhuF
MTPPTDRAAAALGLVAARSADVAVVIARAGAGNALLGFGAGGGRGSGELGDAETGAARKLVAAVAAKLGHPEPRVAASLAVLGYAARLVGPTLAVLLRDGVLLDAAPDRVHYEYDPALGFRLSLPDPRGWHGEPAVLRDAWRATVLDGHLAPLIDAVRAAVHVAAGLLWGNVASGLTGALRALADAGAVPLARCHDTGLALLDHGPLRGSGRLTIHSGRLAFRRRSCCLYYRLPGGGTCADCCLLGGG